MLGARIFRKYNPMSATALWNIESGLGLERCLKNSIAVRLIRKARALEEAAAREAWDALVRDRAPAYDPPAACPKAGPDSHLGPNHFLIPQGGNRVRCKLCDRLFLILVPAAPLTVSLPYVWLADHDLNDSFSRATLNSDRHSREH